MSTASFPPQWRRQMALGAAVVLLHWMVLAWLGGEVRTMRVPAREAEPVTLVALLPAPRPQAKPAAAPVPKPARKRHAPPRHAAPPEPPPAAPEPVADAAAGAPVAGDPAAADPAAGDPAAGVMTVAGADPAAGTQAAPAQRGAADAPASLQSAQQGAPPAGAAPAAAAPEPRRYKVDMPPSARVLLDVARTDADGTRWSGEAQLSWKLDGARYRIQIEAGIRVVFARVNLVVLTSEGAVADSGFAPQTMTEKRRGRAPTATHFNRQDGKITFSASQNSYPLAPGAQDKASVPLQLAAIARGDPAQLAGDIEIQVGEDRDASVFSFVVLGQEEIDTRLGRVAAVHLSRPPKPGSYNSRLDVWLAPGKGWYPVQIRNTEASGAVTTQTVNNIAMTDTGS